MLMERVDSGSATGGLGASERAVHVDGLEMDARGETGARIHSKPRRRQSPQLEKLELP